MAIVTRYFSTAGAGLADGTSWANRAQLIASGTWSSVITGFNFSGSDSLQCNIGPGTYTVTTAFANGLFANPPTQVNPLTFQGCDSSGVALTPPSAGWTSDQAAFSDSSFPALTASTNINMLSVPQLMVRMMKLTMTNSGSNPIGSAIRSFEWCTMSYSSSNASASAVSGTARIINCSIVMTGTSYTGAIILGNTNIAVENVRIQGNPSGSAGNGVNITASTNTIVSISRCTIFNHAGAGINESGSAGGLQTFVERCVLANNGSDGFNLSPNAHFSSILNCMLTGNVGYGIDAGSAAATYASKNRLRNNTSGNFNGMLNYPDFDSTTSAGTDSAEYVDATNGDFRIKNTSSLWGTNVGVSDQPAAGGGSTEHAHVFG